jgi:DNA-binding LytR/AlgR family response regulator
MKPTVLIVEDDFLLAVNLAEVVQQELNAEPVLVASVAEALQIVPDKIAPEKIALAFLDIEILDGKSYPIARKLIEYNVPVIFVSGNEHSSLPEDLKDVPFLPKPVASGRLVKLAKTLSSAFL